MVDTSIPVPDHPPYQLPLSDEGFAHALEDGLGRAWLHAVAHPTASVQALMLDAMLTCQSYDAQCEGDRGGWMLGMADAAAVTERLLPDFLAQATQAPTGDYPRRDLNQRCTILAELVKRDVEEARPVLYRIFHEYDGDPVGYQDIIDVDGAEGLIAVCEELGQRAIAGDKTYIEEWTLTSFDKAHADGAARDALQPKRASLRGVAEFLDRIDADERVRQEHRAQRKRRKKQSEPPPFDPTTPSNPARYHHLSADQAIEWIEKAPAQDGMLDAPYWIRAWARDANEDALELILSKLETESRPLQIKRFLNVFVNRTIEHPPEHAIELLRHQDEGVRRIAYAAFKRVRDERIRSLAKQALTRLEITAGALDLWINNFEPGDAHLIE
ncbi:MAG: hypothetical protein AAFY58_01480, partial [Planctomycetota bacterium]